MGVKGFQKGHIVSKETRMKISKANDGNFFAKCDYCGEKYHTKKSHYEKSQRHFCCRKCYSSYRKEIMPPEEQNAYGTGHNIEERHKRKKARVKKDITNMIIQGITKIIKPQLSSKRR